ncbi:MAG: serine hydrolase domain-containing protein [Ferruginibacter sp.]|nr:beta-lactamase family protein [Bacteroidota bacterium]MBX2919597.1 beta-lactamase family protein [Ferruginibacter sp.]MCC7378816.1 beta-lactamase family protein [Chitinophagaceae bacterium]
MKTSMLLFTMAVLLIAGCKKSSDENPMPGGQNDITAIDNTVLAFMNTYAIPGVSLAITKDDKLVYVKSYGKMSTTDNTAITNDNLFRIASVSKPITSVGIMKLLEAGKLTLDSKVFGPGSILGSDFPSSHLGDVSDVTIRHLLHHTTNAWPNNGSDPMFQQPAMNHSQLISWTLDNYNAVTTRGIYNYSNFGYCILGRVIEKLSGKSYEQFIKDEVLTPCGISKMVMSGNTLADRKPNEVIYTGQNGNNPYLYNITRMDSHGGWLASATDLARFMVKVDGFPGKADILQPSTITTMITKSVPSSNYACGWGVNSANHWWHTGSLPGTATEIIRSNSGFCWVVLCNSRNNSSGFTDALDGLIWPFINDTSTPWQDIDQF